MLNRSRSSYYPRRKKYNNNKQQLYNPTVPGMRYPDYYQMKGRILQTTPANNYEPPTTMINSQILDKYYKTLVDYKYPIPKSLSYQGNYISFVTVTTYLGSLFNEVGEFDPASLLLLIEGSGNKQPSIPGKHWTYYVKMIGFDFQATTYGQFFVWFSNSLFGNTLENEGRLIYNNQTTSTLTADNDNKLIEFEIKEPYRADWHYYVLQGITPTVSTIGI